MKAAVCYAFGEPLQVEEVELDPPQSGEVKVRLDDLTRLHPA